MGPASDLRQKECPRLLSRPAPLAALHTVIGAGAFCVHLPEPKPRSRGHRQAHSHTREPHPPLHRSLSSHCSGTSASPTSWTSRWHLLMEPASFPLLPLTTKMLIASQSQSLKSLTYCVDGIPSLLSPFMWVLMYCHVSALSRCICVVITAIA